jgi:plasmid stability protein
MIKTQIQIEDWQYEAVKLEAAAASRSMSDFIREAVSDALKKGKPPMSLAAACGKYAPLEGAPLKPHDAAWVDAIR